MWMEKIGNCLTPVVAALSEPVRYLYYLVRLPRNATQRLRVKYGSKALERIKAHCSDEWDWLGWDGYYVCMRCGAETGGPGHEFNNTRITYDWPGTLALHRPGCNCGGDAKRRCSMIRDVDVHGKYLLAMVKKYARSGTKLIFYLYRRPSNGEFLDALPEEKKNWLWEKLSPTEKRHARGRSLVQWGLVLKLKLSGLPTPVGIAAPYDDKLSHWDIKLIIEYARLMALAKESESTERYGSPVRLYEQALALDPNNPDAMMSLAVCYARLEQSEKALQLLEQASRLDPDDPRIQAIVSDIRNERGV